MGTMESCQSQKQKGAVLKVDTECGKIQRSEIQSIGGQGAEGMPRTSRIWDQTVVRTDSGEARGIPQSCGHWWGSEQSNMVAEVSRITGLE